MTKKIAMFAAALAALAFTCQGAQAGSDNSAGDLVAALGLTGLLSGGQGRDKGRDREAGDQEELAHV